MSDRKSSRRKKIERPVQNRFAAEAGAVSDLPPEEKHTVYPTSTVSILWDALSTKRKIDDAQRDEIVELYYDIQKKPDSKISQLEKLIEEYPDVQIYYDMLLICYHLEEMESKVLETADLMAKKFPDYVFGKIAMLEAAVQRNQLSKIPDLFQEKYHYRELFPEKGVYHILEVIHYCYAMGKFMAANGEQAEANKYMEEIKSIDPDHVFIKKLQKAIDKASGLKFYQKVFRRFRRG